MQNEQRKFVEKVWPKRATGLPLKTPEEAVTLASIVEREASKADERAARRRGVRQPAERT